MVIFVISHKPMPILNNRIESLGSNVVGDNELKFMSEQVGCPHARTVAQWRNQAWKTCHLWRLNASAM